MKPRTLLVLLILVLGLGAFIWFYERDLPSSEERTEQAKRVLPVEKDDVTAVAIESDAGLVRFERVDSPKPAADKEEEKDEKAEEGEPLDAGDLAPDAEWRITRPFAARADYAAVDGLLSALTTLEKSRTLEDAAPADVGLDKPRATVRLATAEGEKVLKVGAAVPTGGAVIVGIEGIEGIEGDGRAYVVPDAILGEIQKAPGDWRDRQMFHARRNEIEGIRLTGPAGQVVLTQQGERFRIDSPVRDRADREKADSLYADLSGLTAERFVDEPERPLAELGLEPPRAVIEVAVRGKGPVRVELGAPVDPAAPASPDTGEQLLHARIGRQVFETRTRLAETVARPAAEWRSLAVTSFDVYDVDSATLQDGQGSLSLQRAGTDWKRGEETISYVAVSELLFAVTGARADRLVSGPPPGRPLLTLTLKPGRGAAETVSFFRPAAGGAPVRTSGRDAVLLIPAAKLQEIQKAVAEVRKAKPLSKEEKKEG